jgi:hypothetical protein
MYSTCYEVRIPANDAFAPNVEGRLDVKEARVERFLSFVWSIQIQPSNTVRTEKKN